MFAPERGVIADGGVDEDCGLLSCLGRFVADSSSSICSPSLSPFVDDDDDDDDGDEDEVDTNEGDENDESSGEDDVLAVDEEKDDDDDAEADDETISLLSVT